MKRATTAALLAVLLLPGFGRAEEAEAEGTAMSEPEQQGAEVAPPKNKKGAAAKADEAYETYTVKSGDTLWDLSQRYLGNPWYWPKVWSYNPEIENPHWIYPGNTLRFYPGGDQLPAQVEGEAGPVPDVGEVTMGNMKEAERFGEDDDVVAVAEGMKFGYKAPKRGLIRQDGIVTQRELDEAGVIERSFAEKEILDNFERVYVRFRNKTAVRLGEHYSIFRAMERVTHPTTGADFGYLTHIVGTLKIVETGQMYATGVIEHTTDEISRGDFVGPLGNFEKHVIQKDNARQVSGVILVTLERGLPLMAAYHWVFIDKGSRDGVEEGNSFAVIHRGDPLLDDTGKAFPDETVGIVLVVDAKEHVSAGIVVHSMRELLVGDPVLMRPSARQASAVP